MKQYVHIGLSFAIIMAS